ncbi:ATP-dependent metallopeptidase FtsH/Yme1/Tma family protein [Nocardiopsis suaedae]|uniref:ATP-dependent metallopeptidase FtsH/Yme1/Tma family protein n=1 Tax=Nocardiopsis suaedae TaxID=3018444 RepID=UPI0038CDB1E5
MPAGEPGRERGTGDTDGDGTGGERPRASWIRFFITLAAVYLVAFGLTWLTDGRGAATVPYTSFTQQVAAGNVKEVYARGDTIEAPSRRRGRCPAVPWAAPTPPSPPSAPPARPRRRPRGRRPLPPE